MCTFNNQSVQSITSLYVSGRSGVHLFCLDAVGRKRPMFSHNGTPSSVRPATSRVGTFVNRRHFDRSLVDSWHTPEARVRRVERRRRGTCNILSKSRRMSRHRDSSRVQAGCIKKAGILALFICATYRSKTAPLPRPEICRPVHRSSPAPCPASAQARPSHVSPPF